MKVLYLIASFMTVPQALAIFAGFVVSLFCRKMLMQISFGSDLANIQPNANNRQLYINSMFMLGIFMVAPKLHAYFKGYAAIVGTMRAHSYTEATIHSFTTHFCDKSKLEA